MKVMIEITANEAIDRGIWDKLCDIKGINVYAVNEGLIAGDYIFNLSAEDIAQLGIDIHI